MLIPGYIVIIIIVLLILYALYTYYWTKAYSRSFSTIIVVLIVGSISITRYQFIFNSAPMVNKILVNDPNGLICLSIKVVRYKKGKDTFIVENDQKLLKRFSFMLERCQKMNISNRTYPIEWLYCTLLTKEGPKYYSIIISENNGSFIELNSHHFSGIMLGDYYNSDLDKILSEILKSQLMGISGS